MKAMPPPTPARLQRMIERAMRERAPAMHRRLKASGLLEQELAERVARAHQIKDQVIGEPNSPFGQALAMYGDPLAKVAAVNRAVSAAWEQALAVVLEFPPEDGPAETP
jgi:hypothetical protein